MCFCYNSLIINNNCSNNGFNGVNSVSFSIQFGTDIAGLQVSNANQSTGFMGCSRNNSTTMNARVNSTNYSSNLTSGTRATGNIRIF